MTDIIQTRRCLPCSGCGLIEAGGFQKKDCPDCKGTGKVILPDDVIDVLLAKNTDAYKATVEKIKALDPAIDTKEAESLLDNELATPKRHDYSNAYVPKKYGRKYGKQKT